MSAAQTSSLPWPGVVPGLAGARSLRQRRLALLGLSTLVLVTAGGCRGMLPTRPVAIATPARDAIATPPLPRDDVIVYIVISAEQASLLQAQVSADNDARGRHDVVLVVGASQALIINAAGLPGGLPAMRVIDLQPHAGLPGQTAGSSVPTPPGKSP